MDYSDLSGKPLSPGAEAEITVGLPQGKRRRLTVRADEAQKLAESGGNIQSRWARIWGRLSFRIGVPAIIALVATSLIIPAATKQWSDRASASSIRSQIGLALNTSYAIVYYQGLAEYDQTRSTKPIDPTNPPPVHYSKTYLAAGESAENVTATMYLYFGSADSPLYDEWTEFYHALHSFERLACVCGERRWNDDVATVVAYVKRWRTLPPGSPSPSKLGDGLLHCGPGQVPLDGKNTCRTYIKWVANDLAIGRNYLLDVLRKTKPEGYSQGLSDFAHDIVAPFSG